MLQATVVDVVQEEKPKQKSQIEPIKSSDMTLNKTNHNEFIPTILKNYFLKKLGTDIRKQYFTSDIITNILT